MSFANRPRSTSSASLQTKPKKAQSDRRQPWDGTVNDLNAYKASPEDLDRRKAAHRSDHLYLVQDEKLRKKISKAQQKKGRNGNDRGQIAMLREILNDSSQLQESLADSDKLLASLKNILGADPKRFTGLPYLTRAPNGSVNDRSLPDGPNDQSRLDVLSDVIMDRNALNESDSSQSGTDSDEQAPSINYQPALDLVRFQRLLHDAEEEIRGSNRPVKNTAAKINSSKAADATKKGITNKGDKNIASVKHSSASNTTPMKSGPSTMNDTEKIRRMQARTGRDQDASTSAASKSVLSVTPTIDDLNRVLTEVQNNLSDYERHTGKQVERTTAGSFSGYTMALLDTVARMSIYFKECDMRQRTEAVVREQLMEEVVKLTGLVDALTTDLIATQEEYARLSNEFVKHRRETDQQLLSFAHSLSMNGIEVRILRPQQPVQQNVRHATNLDDTVLNGSISSRSGGMTVGRQNGAPFLKSTEHPPLVSGRAVLLASPVQTDSPSVAGGRHSRGTASHDLDAVRHHLEFNAAPINETRERNNQERRPAEQHTSQQQQRQSHPEQAQFPRLLQHENKHFEKQWQEQYQQQLHEIHLQRQQLDNEQLEELGHFQRQQLDNDQDNLGQQRKQQLDDEQLQELGHFQRQLLDKQRRELSQQPQQATSQNPRLQEHLRNHAEISTRQAPLQLDKQRLLYERIQQQQQLHQNRQLDNEQELRQLEIDLQQGQPRSEQQQGQLRSGQQQGQLRSEQLGQLRAGPQQGHLRTGEQQGQLAAFGESNFWNNSGRPNASSLTASLGSSSNIVVGDGMVTSCSMTDIRLDEHGSHDLGHMSLKQQLEELNKQQAVAQRKLDDLMHRQQPEGAGKQVKNAASPSISPITCDSDGNAQASWPAPTAATGNISQPQGSLVRGGATRQIKVTVPQTTRVGEAGDRDLKSPESYENNQRRQADGSAAMQGRVPNNAASRLKGNVNTGFFALSSHVTS